MILKFAWRNIWRHRLRSLVVILAVTIGLWAGIFLLAFYSAVINQKITEVIESEISHFQIHHPVFKQDFSIRYFIPNSDSLVEELLQDDQVAYAAARSITMALINTANGSAGVKVNGIDPAGEEQLTRLDEKLVQGYYLDKTNKRNPILISEKLASRLKVSNGSKVVITFQNAQHDITSAAFRVVGLFSTINKMYDESNVFVKRDDLADLMEISEGHEIAVLLNEHEAAIPVTKKYGDKYENLLVESWMDISPGMGYMVEAMDQYLFIIMIVIMLALVFGIINTMLMAVLERTREFGMLMAVGMNKVRVFLMIMMETIYLAIIGGALGILVGYLTVTYTGQAGIDLSVMSEVLEEFGYATVIYPALETRFYFQIAIQVMVLAVLASLYPARKALKLNPVEAIRKI